MVSQDDTGSSSDVISSKLVKTNEKGLLNASLAGKRMDEAMKALYFSHQSGLNISEYTDFSSKLSSAVCWRYAVVV